MRYDGERARQLLRLGCGDPATDFRDGQEEAIRHLVEGSGRLLVVQRTGWGKSFVYFIAARLLREAGHGPTLLISPLLALMRNQIAAAGRMGVRAATLHSDNVDDWATVERAVRDDEVDLLLVAPERLANERFRGEVLPRIAARLALLVIDEAHCISDWGHDFRPHYRLIERFLRHLPGNVRLLATTATANDRVMDDLEQVLGPGLTVSRGDLHRPSLRLQTIGLPSQAERLAWLAEHLPAMPGSGVVYTLTKRDAHEVADWLRSQGLAVEAYTGDSGDRRPELEQALLDNRVKALVATTALGMGFDKPDLGFVVHYQRPGSVVAYYQQVGRAGRALDAAYGVLLSGAEDEEIADHFIDTAFPAPEEVREVLAALEAAPAGLTVPAMMAHVNARKERIERVLTVLSLESPAPVVKEGSKWQLGVAQVDEALWERAQRLTELRRAEKRQMKEYAGLAEGHMEFLIRALDGDPGELVPPRLRPLPAAASPELVRAALAFLRRTELPIEPRKRWPASGLPRYGVRGNLPPDLQAQPGRALSRWGDAGWGRQVRDDKYHRGRFSDELVTACRELVERWRPEPAPEWVTSMPSLRHPELVPDFARRLAEALGLPFVAVLAVAEERPPQKGMRNSTQQARNIDGALAVGTEGLPTGPVLLVDDMVDSRWTLTIAAWLLRSRGAGEVWPLALALAGAGE